MINKTNKNKYNKNKYNKNNKNKLQRGGTNLSVEALTYNLSWASQKKYIDGF